MPPTETQHLLLIRHAKTLQATGMQRDSERQLSKRGHIQGEQMCSYLTEINTPASATFLCSPSMRTRQTLQLCLPDANHSAVQFLDEIYAAYTGDLLNLLNNQLQQQPRWLVVIGHNPSLDGIVRWLGQNSTSTLIGMATGCIANFTGNGPLLPENWQLERLFKPEKSSN